MLDISTKLLYYKRKEIQQAIVSSCKEREVGIRYDQGFGKRPDVLVYDNDVLDSVKRGATSFHISEERWSNPMQLSTELRKEELEELRVGWDLVLDIDCPYWYYSKLTTYLFVKALKLHKINSISCKFSGNKGFHIGIPFEAFPESINNIPVKEWFPDGPKRIALYLLDYIEKNLIVVKENGEVIFDKLHKTTIKELSEVTGKSEEQLSIRKCSDCMNKIDSIKKTAKTEFICQNCGTRIMKDNEKILVCPKCNILMAKYDIELPVCKKCGSKKPPILMFDPLSIVDVDTILISSRHMFRAPYSLHEKSGLSSVPIALGKILTFEKTTAEPDKIRPENSPIFLDASKTKKDEARLLMTAAFDFGKDNIQYNEVQAEESKKRKDRNFEDVSSAIPVELFPPCMLKILDGLEDGKKRSLFILTNFLTSVGWDYDKAEALLLEWNKKNAEPLREAMVKNQIIYHRQRKARVLPPNCRSYYQDFRVCSPDNLCERIKNPVQYSKRRAFALNKKQKKGFKLSDEQKEMRRVYREKLKKTNDKV